MPKKSKGGTFWSRPVLYVTRETFLVQFLGPTGTFWGFLNFVWGFSTSILSQNIKKLKVGKFLFSAKSLTMPKKTERGDPLVSPGMVCYAGKQEKPFWFSSLGQMVQFGAIIFYRTFIELFWSVQVVLKNTDEKP